MRITKEIVMALEPCYTEEQIDELFAGRKWVMPCTVAKSDIPLVDRLWLLTKLMSAEQQCEFSRRCALDVIHLWDAPDVVREYLETGNEELRSAAVATSWSAASDEAREAAWATSWSAAWAIDASRFAASDEAMEAAWATSTAAASAAARAAVASAAALEKYLGWCVEYLG